MLRDCPSGSEAETLQVKELLLYTVVGEIETPLITGGLLVTLTEALLLTLAPLVSVAVIVQ